VVEQRGVLEREVIPRIMGAAKTVGGKLREIAGTLTEKFGSIVSGLGRVVSRLAGSILKFLIFAVTWLIDMFKQLLQWAVEKVETVVEWITSAIEKLRQFLEPILEVVRWIGRVVADILNLVSGVIKKIWNKIPPCIRDPIKSFLINQILKRIPIFNKLLEIKDIWDKVRGAALDVIRDIFVKWDLKAAILRFFELILTILEIPIDLVKSIYAKARAAFTEIVKDPLGFLRNVLRAAWEGFGLFFGKIGTHLWNGVLDWFRGQMKKAGIEIPTEFSFKAILGLIFSIAGISVEKLFEILEKKLKNKPLVAKIRKFYKLLTGVWEWVTVALEQGALGLWEKIKQTAGDLWDGLVTALVGWVSKEVIKLASPRLLAALNPVGAIINAILAAWAAIQTAAEYAKQILEIVNTVLDTALDLARGITGRAAEFVENALAAAIPMAVGFLANFVRLGNLGERVKEMLEPVQKKVEEGIGAILDTAISAGRAILDKLGIGGPAKEEVAFDAGGESHRLFAEGEGDTEEVWLESTRRTAAGWIDYWEKNDLPELPRSEDRDESKANIKSARSLLTKRKKSKETKLSEVADILKKLFQMFGHPSVKPTVLFFRGNTDSNGVRGGFAKAEPLTLKFPEGGDRPSSSTSAPVPGEKRMAQMNRATEKWVKLHLIHFDLGGPDKSQNFAIGDKTANTSMFKSAEEKVIDLLTGHAKGALTLWYETKAEYRTGKNIDFLKAITAEWGEYDIKTGTRLKSTSGVLSFDSGAPGKRETSVVINDDGPDSLEVIGELESRIAKIVRDAARTGAPQRLANLKQLEKAVLAVRPNFSQDQVDEVVAAVRTGLDNETLTWEP
jgi:phage-related protein